MKAIVCFVLFMTQIDYIYYQDMQKDNKALES